MKRLIVLLVIPFLALALAAPALAQIPPDQRNRLTLSYTPISDGSRFDAELTYALGPSWDYVLAYTSFTASAAPPTEPASSGNPNGFGVAFRYHLPIHSPGNTLYLGGGFGGVTFDSAAGTVTGSGLALHVGGEITLTPKIAGFGDVAFVGGGSIFNTGLRLRASQTVGLVLGYRADTISPGNGNVSFGLSFEL